MSKTSASSVTEIITVSTQPLCTEYRNPCIVIIDPSFEQTSPRFRKDVAGEISFT